jgi:heterotetrameric sarcosine oxidase delta subunit
MIILKCPNCGERNVSEFRYGGEVLKRPNPNTASNKEMSDYLYMRDNPLGEIREWWYHRSGCAIWFIAERHTKTHDVLNTYLWSPEGSDNS